MNAEAEMNEANEWHGDVLGRKPYADFLTQYILSRSRYGYDEPLRPFTLAIDAEWGYGKTFFVEHWITDLQSAPQPRITLLFDAWKSDYASDPVVSFMAEFKARIDNHIKLDGNGKNVRQGASKAVERAFNGMRRAIMPAGKVVLASVLKKTTGVAFDEVIDAFKSDESAPSDDGADKLSEAAIEAINNGLDTFFSKALEEQSERRQAIVDFKNSMQQALQELSGGGAQQQPMFVFIDELDRCRPDFAISLLEGVKHLFDIPGVCFVITTNLRQLSASVKAIYGQDFDGHGYLKRLFDAEFSLPQINIRDYARLLVEEYPELNKRSILGLPPPQTSGDSQRRVDASDVLAWVADSFVLDLRSLRKVVETIVAASTGVPKEKKIFLLWMASLAAIRHKDPKFFDALDSSGSTPMGNEEFTSSWKQVAAMDNFRDVIVHGENFRREGPTIRRLWLCEVALLYYHHSFMDMSKTDERRQGYPNSVQNDVEHYEMPSHFLSDCVYRPSTSKYFSLIRNAGHLISD